VKIAGPAEPLARLIYLPFAGGASATVKPWLPAVPAGVEVVGVRLPGRESRLQEPPLQSVEEVLSALDGPLRALLDRPYALLGHSLGALLAFELVRHLRRQGLPQPALLAVSGRRAPHLPSLTRHVHALPEDDLVEELRGYQGTPEIILRDRQVRALFLPAIRADFKISEQYAHAEEAPLQCPVIAFGGRRDALVPVADLQAWARHTIAGFEAHLLPGGHFFQYDDMSPALEALAHALRELLPQPSDAGRAAA
jgi:surfactin synthase thioesterase subunit